MGPRVGKAKPLKSRPVRVTVLQWHYLTSISPRRVDAVGSGLDAFIRGELFDRSVVSLRGAASRSADWNLPPSCVRLELRLGAGDDGETDATARLALTGDGLPLYSDSFGLTESTKRVFDVSGVFRLAFTWSSFMPGSAEPAPGAQAVLGTPLLLCAF